MNFSFLYPNVLLLLILLGGLLFLLFTNKNNMQRFFSDDILEKLITNKNSINNRTRNLMFFITLILFILALARPIANEKEQNIKQKYVPIVIALDVSKSMNIGDIYPSRLSLAKKKLKQIVNLSSNSLVGIVIFARNSYIVSPITSDFISLNYIVDNLDTTLNFENGSNIFAVLEATKQMFLDYKVKNLIILSDGGNDNQYKEELEFAKENKIIIYTIGIATKNGAPIPDKDGYITDSNGNIITLALNTSIKNLAINSGGGYIDFSLAKDDVKAIINQIHKQSNQEEYQNKKVKIYTELFYYPLAFGIFILLCALSSFPSFNKNIMFLLFVIIFYPQQNSASILDFKIIEKAKINYKNKEYKKAIQNYSKLENSNEKNYNIANAYYKNKEYKKAIQNYNKIITSKQILEYKKLHNLGNCYVKEKNLQKAKDIYEKALKIKNDIQTRKNLEAVKKALKKQKAKKNKNKQNNNNSKDKQKKNNNKSNHKQSKNKMKQQNKTVQSKIQKNKNISNMEEKKWLKTLQKRKIPIMLQKVKTSTYQHTKIQNPW